MPDDTNALVPLSRENLALSLTDEHYDETTQCDITTRQVTLLRLFLA